ncbi:hypothetical protein [Alicyclobacillus acidiphilus]|uniref:hypothetical protein n=1 Tax=Alicyclobacillus acidiphilus TaxID=182455 RepID=UPI0008362971|nr:hypothetical protein [Alicyclobacillus acidiphilus]
MTWLALVASASVVAIDWRSLRSAKRREIVLYIVLICMTLTMAVCLDIHLFHRIDLLSPVNALFRPLTEWLYRVL